MISTLPVKGEESLNPSTKKQLKSELSRWRIAPQLQTKPETVDAVSLQRQPTDPLVDRMTTATVPLRDIL